jgi:hypothetical protein
MLSSGVRLNFVTISDLDVDYDTILLDISVLILSGPCSRNTLRNLLHIVNRRIECRPAFETATDGKFVRVRRSIELTHPHKPPFSLKAASTSACQQRERHDMDEARKPAASRAEAHTARLYTFLPQL